MLVDQLGLKITKHPNPYTLQWLSERGEIRVSKQVLITFSIGKYKDEVLCDVAPMEVGHLLLDRPWEFDKDASHSRRSNRYTFLNNGRKTTLVPLTPLQVYQSQLEVKKEYERRAKLREAQSGE